MVEDAVSTRLDSPKNFRYRPIAMDVLSDALKTLRPNAFQMFVLEASGEWCLRLPAFSGIKLVSVLRGEVYVKSDQQAHAHRFQAGDCYLLTRGDGMLLASDPELPPAAVADVCRTDVNGVLHYGEGAGAVTAGAHFQFGGNYAECLFRSLPAVICMRADSPQAEILRWGLNLFAREFRSGRCGSKLTAEHLSQIMLVQFLRMFVEQSADEGQGWLYALRDPQLLAALTAFHANVEKQWSVEHLARVAGMSRSGFAERFTRILGQPPLEYVTHWRMEIAADRLTSSNERVSRIALQTGYRSEAAFSTAFSRIFGRSPKTYRRSSVSDSNADGAASHQ